MACNMLTFSSDLLNTIANVVREASGKILDNIFKLKRLKIFLNTVGFPSSSVIRGAGGSLVVTNPLANGKGIPNLVANLGTGFPTKKLLNLLTRLIFPKVAGSKPINALIAVTIPKFMLAILLPLLERYCMIVLIMLFSFSIVSSGFVIINSLTDSSIPS